MAELSNVVVVYPAGISDTMLATPVSAVLKQEAPAAKITAIAEPRLCELLLSVCPSIDEAVELDARAGRSELMALVKELSPELLINLSQITRKESPIRSAISLFKSASPYVELTPTHGKNESIHQVNFYLTAFASLGCSLPTNPFPTIFPEALIESQLLPLLQLYGLSMDEPIVGLVPGVGAKMTSKAWFNDGWLYLIRALKQYFDVKVLLLGGQADVELCRAIAAESSEQCIDLSGKLTLVQAATLIKALALLISGDCGLLHIARAASTPVIGLYGPTSSKKRGPYGQDELVIDQNVRCECSQFTQCHGLIPGPGDCMRRIQLDEIIDLMRRILGGEHTPPAAVRDSLNWFWTPAGRNATLR